jgi:hypothetical protein
VVARPEVSKATLPAARVKQVYRAVLSRSPTANELELATTFISGAEKEPVTGGKLTAWEQLAQVLLMSNEFAFAD